MKTTDFIIKTKLKIIGFFRRAFILVLTLMIRRSFFRKIIGLLNHKASIFRSIFVCYPGRTEYALHFCFPWMLSNVKTSPLWVGFFSQGSRLGLILATSITEKDFVTDKNRLLLEELINTVKLYCQDLHINNVNFSGILPNILQRKNIHISNNTLESREYVCSVIHKAEQVLQKLENIPNNSPLIILGGNGFIGEYLCTKFTNSGRELHIVDINIPFPKHLTGQQSILIDVARKGAIDNYISDFWHGLVVLNETYPEPSRKSLVMLRKAGVKVYHVAGVKAKSFPAFPLAYENAIPCCAMHSNNGVVPHVIKLI